MCENIITRFDSDNPCWTAELLIRAGEDVGCLQDMVKNGLLEDSNGIYSLTAKGIEIYESLKDSLFIEKEAGRQPAVPSRSVAITKLRMLIDNAHTQRWGIKNFLSDISLKIHPKLVRKEIFSVNNGSIEWEYTKSPVWKQMEKDFPMMLIEDRSADAVKPEKLYAWYQKNSPEPGIFDIDLLYLCHYDFMQYRDFKGHPNDAIGLINADRFLFVFPGQSMDDILETIGKFHIGLINLRRMIIPGYVDRDTQEQDSVNWLVFAVERENEAVRLANELQKYGPQLVRNANPCEIWTISFEALENLEEKRELIWELLPDIAHQAQRTIS